MAPRPTGSSTHRWASASCWSTWAPPRCRAWDAQDLPLAHAAAAALLQPTPSTPRAAALAHPQRARAARRRADRPAASHAPQPGARQDPARRDGAHAALAAGHLHDRHGQPPAAHLAAGTPARPHARPASAWPPPPPCAARPAPPRHRARGAARTAQGRQRCRTHHRPRGPAPGAPARAGRPAQNAGPAAELLRAECPAVRPIWLKFAATPAPPAGCTPLLARHRRRARGAGARRRRDRPGFDAELDELRAIQTNCDAFLLELETRERARTGIPNLQGAVQQGARLLHRGHGRATWTRCPTTTAAARR
jgi:DNA mismatch repair protein MutS